MHQHSPSGKGEHPPEGKYLGMPLLRLIAAIIGDITDDYFLYQYRGGGFPVTTTSGDPIKNIPFLTAYLRSRSAVSMFNDFGGDGTRLRRPLRAMCYPAPARIVTPSKTPIATD
jgi:hypothetical protein